MPGWTLVIEGEGLAFSGPGLPAWLRVQDADQVALGAVRLLQRRGQLVRRAVLRLEDPSGASGGTGREVLLVVPVV